MKPTKSGIALAVAIIFLPASLVLYKTSPNTFTSFLAIISLPVIIGALLYSLKTYNWQADVYTGSAPLSTWKKRKESIIAEYGPPADLSLLEMGFLADRRIGFEDVLAVIVDLGIRGYLKLERKTQSLDALTGEFTNFDIVKLRDGKNLESTTDKKIFDFLFDRVHKLTRRDVIHKSLYGTDIDFDKISLDDFISTSLYIARDIGPYVTKNLYERGYLKPIRVNLKAIVYSFLFFVVLSFIAAGFNKLLSVNLLMLGFFVSSVILIWDTVLSPRLTPKGANAVQKIIGFAEFLRMKHNPTSIYPEAFEKNLPYAIAFGLTEQWSNKFDGIYNTVPAWLEDHSLINQNGIDSIKIITRFKR